MIRSQPAWPQAGKRGAQWGAALEFHGMALAIGEADGLHPWIAAYRPGKAGGAILATGEQHEGGVIHGCTGSLSLEAASPYLRRMDLDLDFSEDEIRRYSRHILLQDVGGVGQARLKSARVLVVGAGGLGSPLALYLSAAGIGTLGIVDHDRVELSNLQRQIAHTTGRIGELKAESAATAVRAINPEVRAEPYSQRLDANNVLELIQRYEIICDGTDNFATRFLLADACVLARRTLVSAAVLRFEGQLSVFKPHQHAGGPCYRCLYPEPPAPGTVPTCSEAGVLGAVTGVMGTLQATEVLKEILGVGDSLSGKLLIWDALATRFRLVRLRADPDCALCGPAATIRDLSQHQDTVAAPDGAPGQAPDRSPGQACAV
jgi:molybdopterin-synthase adenylyltransferase